ncbi:MAG: hypothetical protein NUV60_03565 [Patescibacteria group bacterium]|nr:hypothetical protein [Patescibacteria group bacterium]
MFNLREVVVMDETREILVVPAKPKDVKEEARFQNLNGRGFVRAETAGYQWYLLVNEACEKSKLPVDNLVREYLGAMLHRFMTRAGLFKDLSSFNFYQHMLGIPKTVPVCLQEVADICLQYVAFFPEQSGYRHQPRTVEHVANMGTSLYYELARASMGKDDFFSRALQLMPKSFGRSVMVLRSVCPRFAHRRTIAAEWERRRQATCVPSVAGKQLSFPGQVMNYVHLQSDDTPMVSGSLKN